LRTDILKAVRRASEILDDFNMKSRVSEGYTRIDPALIASYANVTLIYKPLEKLLGSFIRIENTAGILVNNDRPRGLVHMTCAHELGHFFLEHDSNTDITVEYGSNAANLEQDANFFAYSLLAPRWLVAKTMREMRWSRQDLQNPIIIYQLSLRLGISYTAMIWSLASLNLLTTEALDELLKIQPKTIKQMITSDPKLKIGNHDVWLLNVNDKDHILEPAIGDKYIFDLPNHLSSGHLWEIDEAISAGFCISPFVVNKETQAHIPYDGSIIIGGKKTHKYILNLPDELNSKLEAGDAELSINRQRQQIALSESKIWIENAKINEFSLYTEFESIKNGFSSQEKEKRIASIEKPA
jgi:Zn-dependent peptidase ImmA (M78 family)